MELRPPQLDWRPAPPCPMTGRRACWLVLIVVILAAMAVAGVGCVQTEARSPSGWHFRTTRVGTDTRLGTVRIPTTQGSPVEIIDYDAQQQLAATLDAAAKVVRGR